LIAIRSLISLEEYFEEAVPLVWIRTPLENMLEMLLKFLVRFGWVGDLPKLFEIDGSLLDVQQLF
jgi:hypothetical protein